METVKARLTTLSNDCNPVIPIVIPDLADVRTFANRLHKRDESWQGVIFGWSAKYNPQQSEPPPDSKMTFTPADFCIGESAIWFFSMVWENGHDAPPVEFLDDINVVGRVKVVV